MDELSGHTAATGNIGVDDMVYASHLQFAFALMAICT